MYVQPLLYLSFILFVSCGVNLRHIDQRAASEGINTAPLCPGDQYQNFDNDYAFYSFSFSLFCSDPDGDSLEYSIYQSASHGTLELVRNPELNFRYQPHADYLGADQFKFKVSDGTHEHILIFNANVTQ